MHPSQDPRRGAPDDPQRGGPGPGWSPPGYSPPGYTPHGYTPHEYTPHGYSSAGHPSGGQSPPDGRPTVPGSSPRSRRGFDAQPGGRGRAVRLDPVLVEMVVALVWLTVGTLGLSSSGGGTVLLAVAIGVCVWIGVENRRVGPGAFDPTRSVELLRLAGGATGVVIVASILLGLIGAGAYLPGLAAVVTGGAFVLLSRVTAQRPTLWLGVAVVVLGLLSAFLSTQTATEVVSQGLVGLLIGVLVLVSAADRVGLLALVRDRLR